MTYIPHKTILRRFPFRPVRASLIVWPFVSLVSCYEPMAWFPGYYPAIVPQTSFASTTKSSSQDKMASLNRRSSESGALQIQFCCFYELTFSLPIQSVRVIADFQYNNDDA